MARRRHLRPARRRLRPLLGRRRLARPPLREDALRQRPAGPRLPARLAGARARALPPRLRGDARLGAARDARARGRLLLGPRRRLRGRGGPLLRLDAGRDREAAGPTTTPSRVDRLLYGVSEAGNFEGANILHLRRRRRRPPGPAGLERGAAGAASRRGRSGSGRGSTTSGSTSWNALVIARPRRGRRRARARGLPRRGARAAPSSCSTELRDGDGRPAAHLQGRPSATSTPTSRTTPSCSRRC